MNIKKTVFNILRVLLPIALFLTLSLRVSAKDVNEEYSEFFSSLPSAIKDALPESAGTNPEEDSKAITSWDFLLSALGEGFVDGFKRIIPSLCALLGLLLISSVINTVKSSLDAKTSDVLSICSNAALSLAFISLQINTVLSVASFLSDILTLVNIMTALIVLLYSSGGNVAGASVSATAMTVFMNFTENVIAKTAIPFAGICLCFLTVSCIASDLGTDRLIKLIKSAYVKILSFMASVFCAILAAQSAIAAGSDSVSMRAVKFFTGSAIPIVGGSVNESMRMLAGSIGMLRKCFGIMGIIIISLLTLPPLFLLLLSRFSLNLAASAADILHCPAERKLLDGISETYGILIAAVSVCALMFVFLLTLFSLSSAAILGGTP